MRRAEELELLQCPKAKLTATTTMVSNLDVCFVVEMRLRIPPSHLSTFHAAAFFITELPDLESVE